MLDCDGDGSISQENEPRENILRTGRNDTHKNKHSSVTQHARDTAALYVRDVGEKFLNLFSANLLVPSRLRENELGVDPAVRGLAGVLLGVILELHHELNKQNTHGTRGSSETKRGWTARAGHKISTRWTGGWGSHAEGAVRTK